MEKYRRVIDPDKQNALFPDDPWVLRINVSGKLANLIAYAERRLFDDELGKVELVALGRAINRAVTVAEILRRNHPTVHQLTTLRSVSMRNKFVPLEEGLRELELDRTSSCISIVIAKGAAGLDTEAAGYAPPDPSSNQAPISDETIAEMDLERAGSSHRRGRGGRGRGGRGRRGRGGRGGHQQQYVGV